MTRCESSSNGQQAFGADVLKALLERGRGRRRRVLRARQGGPAARSARRGRARGGHRAAPARVVRDRAEAAAELAGLEPDLMVMAFVILKVPEAVLNAPTHGTIQYHPSLLPRHRGPSAINWAIIHGDAKTGLAIFWPDDGPRHRPGADDQGGRDHDGRHARQPVLRQALPARHRGDGRERRPRPRGARRRGSRRTRRTRPTRAGAAGRTSRSTGRARCARCTTSSAAPNPRPGAWTTIDGEEVGILDAERIDDDPGVAPGEVVAVDGDRLVVAADGGAIAVRRAGRRRKTAAGDYARAAGVEAGAALGARRALRRTGLRPASLRLGVEAQRAGELHRAGARDVDVRRARRRSPDGSNDGGDAERLARPRRVLVQARADRVGELARARSCIGRSGCRSRSRCSCAPT